MGCWSPVNLFVVVTYLSGVQSHYERSDSKFLLTVPTRPRFDSPYTATVTAFNVIREESVELSYRGYKTRDEILYSNTLLFTEDGVQNWTVTFPWDRMYGEVGITLVMSTNLEVNKTLFFNSDTGYILIQTDKPIYTPRQTVKFRIIAVDEYERLAKYPMKVDIKNERNIVVDRMYFTAVEAFKAQEFELPKETPPGNWTISANFEGKLNDEGKLHSVTFEVKEYVLPRFWAEMDISTDVITKSTNWITISVTAKYVYGYYLLGSVEIQLGVWDPISRLQLLPQKYVTQLTKGYYEEDFRVSKLIPKNLTVGPGKRLYVAVNVTELGTGENVTIVDTSTFIAHPYYDITYTDSKIHFKPGFDYTLHTQVRARNGRPASWVKMWIEVEYLDESGTALTNDPLQYELDKNGKLVADFSVPGNAHTIKFTTYALDFKAGRDNMNTLTVPKMWSVDDQYLHIKLLDDIEEHSDRQVRLQYTPPELDRSDHKITLTVLSKGHIVYVTSMIRSTDGQSIVRLPKRLYNQVSPSMRVVASYFHIFGTKTELVVDSLNVDTTDVCVQELTLARPMWTSNLHPEPKDNYKMVVSGGSGMHVGMVAVDEAVLLLNDRRTFTRELMFQQLGSHDQGTGSGDGVGIEKVWENSGLVHLLLDNSKRSIQRLLRLPTALRLSEEEGHWMPRLVSVFSDDRIEEANNQNGISRNSPLQTTRHYFPESWLFQEFDLPESGETILNMTLPDSITTWSFMAVGVSANRGICVSSPLKQEVQKLFFVDVRMPYKVTRLEEVKVKIAVYNLRMEPIEVEVKVTGSYGLCFSANRNRGTEQNSTRFRLEIGKRGAMSRDIKVIALVNGELTLKVDAYHLNARDIVEKKIYVVAEGRRIKKSITFVLDPEAKHTTFNPKTRRKVTLANTATIKNSVNVVTKTQKTEIDLAMPKEVIRGTPNCKIAAFGDLMGDIINHAVVKSKSLMEHSVQDAEQVLGDLGPTVHALLYAKMSGLMDQELAQRARKFVTHGVVRLVHYKKGQAFAMTPTSEEATWLTTAVLKTLCRSTNLTVIDKPILIDHGFYWLLSQRTNNGTLRERDWRLAKNNKEYQIMLSAEVLIAILECERYEEENHNVLMAEMADFLETHMPSIQSPMVLAKVVYALTLHEALMDRLKSEEGHEGEGMEEEYPVIEEEEEVEGLKVKVSKAVKKLATISKKNDQGQVYWSSEEVTNEGKAIPFWYRKGPKASAIEATAFSLLVFLNHPGANVDAIADWLVAQRNQNGFFIGARDSVAAIQALSTYSLQKSSLTVDLSCSVTSDKAKQYSHSFNFTQHNAMQPESISDVPVGHSLEVLTNGQGLGQMQILVQYNVPIDPNEKCDFNVTLDVKWANFNFFPDMHKSPPSAPSPISLPLISDPICKWCRRSCRPILGRTTRTTRNAIPVGQHRKRSRRSVRSRSSISITVCLQHAKRGRKGETRVDIDMLTGHRPLDSDIKRMKELPEVLDAVYDLETDSVVVVLKEVSDTSPVCVSFRVVDHEEVERLAPANVIVTEVGNPDPSCALEYKVPATKESLQVYCADSSNRHKGECRCFSGDCSTCNPDHNTDPFNFGETKKLVCKSDVGYQLEFDRTDVINHDEWVAINAKILSVNKTGKHQVKTNDIIKIMSPASCLCPTLFRQMQPGPGHMYMLSTDVEKMVDRFGNSVYHYILDEKSTFLMASDPESKNTIGRRVPHWALHYSFDQTCP